MQKKSASSVSEAGADTRLRPRGSAVEVADNLNSAGGALSVPPGISQLPLHCAHANNDLLEGPHQEQAALVMLYSGVGHCEQAVPTVHV